MPDPDLEIREGEGRSSRPLDKGGGEGAGLQKIFLDPLGLSLV